MKLSELLDNNLVFYNGDNKYKCSVCGKVYSKIGIGNHYFYNHTDDGLLKKQELRDQAIKNNNDPLMKKKISDNTKKVLNTDEVKQKLYDYWNDPKVKQWCSDRNKKLWNDPIYRNKTIDGIRKSRTTEFKKKLSKIMIKVQNDPNSKVKSKEFSDLQSKIVKGHWSDNDQYEKRCKIFQKSWDNRERRINQSLNAKNMWGNPNHILKVLKGKLRTSKNNDNLSYGKIGETKNGTIYESKIEKDIFEFLEDNNVQYVPHKQIPYSTKICDLVLNDIWIEIDGLGRNDPKNSQYKNFNEKIDHYNKLRDNNEIVDFKIFNSFDQFKDWFTKEEE